MSFKLYSAFKNSLPKLFGQDETSKGPKLSPEVWLAQMEQERIDIAEYSTFITNEFMGHSQTLESLIEDIEKLKVSCNAVIKIISDEAGDTPVQFAYQLFKKSNDIINASFDQFRIIFDSVKGLREQIQSVEASQSQLAKITVPLKMITVQYRITASMMDEATRAEFYDLADKLNGLVSQINDSIKQQFTDLSETKQVCNTIIDDLEAMIAEYESQIEAQVGSSKLSLETLGQSLGTSHDLIHAISTCSEKLSEGVFSIMVSMQAQDMTSQKLEHVSEAIDSICERLRPNGSKTKKAALYFAKEAGKIQANQLNTLFTDLENATESIRATTLNTESETEKIANATKELSEVGSQNDLLNDSGQSVKKILGFVEATIDKTRGVLLSLAPLQNKFTDSTATVMNIAAEMRMVAINAQVYAASVSDGEALEVLSHSTQVQSNQTRQSIEAISKSLAEVASSLDTTEAQLSNFTEMGQMDLDYLLEESDIAQEELKRMEIELPEMLNYIQTNRTVVAQKTRDFSEKLNVDSKIKDKATRILDVFKQISTAEIGIVKEETIEEENQNLSNLKSNYTMQSEVDNHVEVTGETATDDFGFPAIADAGDFDSFEDFSGSESDDIFDDFATQDSIEEKPTDDSFENVDDRMQESAEPVAQKKQLNKVEKIDDNIDLF